MAKRLKQHIEEALENLTGDDLKRFKRELNGAKLEPGFNAIPMGRLEHADAMDIADRIVNFYREDYGLRLTAEILVEINQCPLADRLREAMQGGGASGTRSEADAGARPPPAETHFVDQHRQELITRNSVIAPVLDSLLGKQLTQEQYEAILAKDTSQNRMRELYRHVNGWGRADKDQLYEALKANNRPLVSDLEDQ